MSATLPTMHAEFAFFFRDVGGFDVGRCGNDLSSRRATVTATVGIDEWAALTLVSVLPASARVVPNIDTKGEDDEEEEATTLGAASLSVVERFNNDDENNDDEVVDNEPNCIDDDGNFDMLTMSSL